MNRFHSKACPTFVALLTLMVALTPARADEADQLFQTLFGEKMKAALATRDFDDDLAVAKELLGSVVTVKDEPRFIEVLCTKAYDLCVRRPDGYHLAAEAMALMHRHVPGKRLDALENLVAVGRKIYIRSAPDERKRAAKGMVNNMLLLAGEQDEAGDAQACVATLRQARQYAIAAKLDNVKDVSTYYDRALERYQLIQRKEKLDGELLRNAGNSAAAEELVRMFMVEFDSPSKALEFSDRMKNPELANIVKLANQPLDKRTSEELLAVADWYRLQMTHPSVDLQKVMARRAAAGYTAFLNRNDSSSLLRAKAELSYKQLEKVLNAEDLASLATGGSLVGAGNNRPVDPPTNQPGNQPSNNTPPDLGPQTHPKDRLPENMRPGVNPAAFASVDDINRNLAKGEWVEVLGLVDGKLHCTGGFKVSRSVSARFFEVILEPTADTESTVTIPVAIDGTYEVKIKSQLIQIGGTNNVYLPTDRGWTNISVNPGLNAVGRLDDIRFIVDRAQSGKPLVSIYANDKLADKREVPDGNLRWTKERLNNSKPTAIMLLNQGVVQKFFSLQLRIIKGKAIAMPDQIKGNP